MSDPCVDLYTTFQPLALPPDLDTYLARRESTHEDIMPGTEKKIVSVHTLGKQTPLSIVYVHGFSASRQDTAPLAAEIAAQLHANLYSTRLRGHVRGGEAMLDGSVNGWVNDIHEAVEINREALGTSDGNYVDLYGRDSGGLAGRA
ncbi:MAG: hypothetical protein Q7U88_12110 [Desulfocapsaceae bacterium]|nr:hypothetical protein [Desulfocapsaceae bacterium]